MKAQRDTVRIGDKGVDMVLELSGELYQLMLESEYIAVNGGQAEITPTGYAYLQALRFASVPTARKSRGMDRTVDPARLAADLATASGVLNVLEAEITTMPRDFLARSMVIGILAGLDELLDPWETWEPKGSQTELYTTTRRRYVAMQERFRVRSEEAAWYEE